MPSPDKPISDSTLQKPVDGDNDADSQSYDSLSETSSIIYSHETFETYKGKVTLLLASLFSYDVASRAILTRLQGGSYNRIIGISIPSVLDRECSTSEELILRVPRFEAADVQAASLLLNHLYKENVIPSPEVIHYDSSSGNALEQPYILMRRFEGESLLIAQSKMTHRQRLALAKTIAQLMARIHDHPVPAGIGPLCVTDDGSLFIGRYIDEGKYECLGENYTPPSTIHEFFQTRFTHLAIPGPNEIEADWGPAFYRRLREVSKHILNGVTTSKFSRNVLFHRDFSPRNIIVRPVTTETSGEEWELSGIIDWDGCEVTPVEVAYNCPGWVWAHPDEASVRSSYDEEDWDPDALVFNDDCREIKETFLDEIERLMPGFMMVVRQVRQRPLKKLWRLARNGMHSNEDAKIGEEILAAVSAVKND